MTDGWSAIVVAGCALLGSLIGGFVGPLVISWIEHRRTERRDRSRRGEERRSALNARVSSYLSSLLDLQLVSQSDEQAQAQAAARMMSEALELGLLLNREDDPVSAIISDSQLRAVAKDPSIWDAMALMTSVLPTWLHGECTAQEALERYRSTIRPQSESSKNGE